MLSIPHEARYGAVAMTPQKFKDETVRALVDTVEAAARRRPTVLLFEDLHWADPTTLETMDLLIHRVRNVPLLVVITHRPEFPFRWSHHGHVSALSLSKLTRAEQRDGIRLAGGKALPDLFEQIGKTDGVPLFVEELTKSILESAESGMRATDGNTRAMPARSRSPSPARLSLMARLDRFAPGRRSRRSVRRSGASSTTDRRRTAHPKPELDRGVRPPRRIGLAFQRARGRTQDL